MPLPLLAALGAGQALIGGIQSLIGGGRAKRAQRELENLATPTTTADPSVQYLYNNALNRATNAYTNPLYLQQQKNVNRSQAAGLSALNDRRGGVAGISRLVALGNDSLERAAANADAQAQSQLGSATRMKAADNERMFNINQMLPYQKKFSLLSAKAGGANQLMNAGLSNAFGGIQTAALGFSPNDTIFNKRQLLGQGGSSMIGGGGY